MIALDTNVVSELMRPQPDARVVSWATGVPNEELALPAMALAEMVRGLERLPAGTRRRGLESLLSTFLDRLPSSHVLAFDGRAAVEFALLSVSRERAGLPIATPDAVIAATCRAHGASLATRNVRDFDGTGVSLVDPWVSVA